MFSSEQPLDEFFDNARQEIFPMKSPISNLEPVEEKPTKRVGKLAKLAASRVTPLLKAREEVNDVYSDGYFESHYPQADKTLKGLLHDQVLDAWDLADSEVKNTLSDVADGRGGLGSNKKVTVTDNRKVDISADRKVSLSDHSSRSNYLSKHVDNRRFDHSQPNYSKHVDNRKIDNSKSSDTSDKRVISLTINLS